MWLRHNASATPKQSKTKLFPEDKYTEIQSTLVEAMHVAAIVVAMVSILAPDFFSTKMMDVPQLVSGGVFDFTQINNR